MNRVTHTPGVGDFSASYLGRLRQHVGHELLLSPGAQVVVIRGDGLVLMQRRADSGLWEIPAGGCEPGQSFASAAITELAEETGLRASTGDLEAFVCLSDPEVHTLRYPNGDMVHAFAMCFVWRSGEARVAPGAGDGEVTEHRWVATDELPEPVHPPSRVVLALYEAYQVTGQFQAR